MTIDTTDDKALAHLDAQITEAMKRTVGGHLFPEDMVGLYKQTARRFGLTVADVQALDWGRE